MSELKDILENILLFVAVILLVASFSGKAPSFLSGVAGIIFGIWIIINAKRRRR